MQKTNLLGEETSPFATPAVDVLLLLNHMTAQINETVTHVIKTHSSFTVVKGEYFWWNQLCIKTFDLKTNTILSPFSLIPKNLCVFWLSYVWLVTKLSAKKSGNIHIHCNTYTLICVLNCVTHTIQIKL